MSVTYENTLSASITSLASQQRPPAAQIAKTYRQAAQLFLTRRLPEALSTIEPIITPEHPDDDGLHAQGKQNILAPIAYASRGTRIKVWSFYLTFLNSVVELGPEEGKHAFGSTRWKASVAKCRDGSVWEEVVQAGYAGAEGSVDPDVVINLATLLLTHAPSQQVTQQRLETYLSASSQPTFDITAHMNSPLYAQKRPGIRSHGTNTPRDLNSRLKLLELYTLHVLPRNGEWDYAREFIGMSEVLDDERKEAFLLALHGLKEEQENAANYDGSNRNSWNVVAKKLKHVGEKQKRRKTGGDSLTQNPMAFLRTLLFLLAFALAFGRQDLRDRVKRLLRLAWEKLRRTVGMGVKVSYI
ncbi:hypothetical protein SLS56_009540 [Neofusicoccum ribis]|uniref:Peroxin 26 n=1 Tax=Neofusicoccum ribis TaxID=45134 RepID=A0ABR3SHD4_9PEZI